jgi:hypothetical protein
MGQAFFFWDFWTKALSVKPSLQPFFEADPIRHLVPCLQHDSMTLTWMIIHALDDLSKCYWVFQLLTCVETYGPIDFRWL